ncbi:DJ-1/PfpI family protein [Aminobacter sp. AP02]|uniref:DJ-1/PfpI family protein n=1 Tax=Aminobacter sp. AP02 TaxID=2135737 RepID=UPI000D6C977E|nr:DJ-1/PfpI family protein [Aminobacter sp. AP02]PWK60758.1 putative intracellular protease/amidase [Aminobacter sp. AP02]
MTDSKTIGLLFIEGYADWEYGLLAASAVEWFGVRAVAISPHASPLTSIAGLRLNAQRSANPEENQDLDAVAVIGSDGWAENDAPDVAPLLRAVAARGGVVGGICAGTLALARAGLFEGTRHTSNGRDWILGHEPGYAGAGDYQDVPHAVADRKIVSAPGSAPGTFAVAFLKELLPENGAQFGEMRAMFAREYGDVS